ncbi:hypothetical protein VNO77_03832 [Canavalia gladiata]|uniref:Uncharacterized protein n=1 Tax=Canavalia gladiata TaxID=3824 RepID=A0AAN9MVE3_CANGL
MSFPRMQQFVWSKEWIIEKNALNNVKRVITSSAIGFEDYEKGLRYHFLGVVNELALLSQVATKVLENRALASMLKPLTTPLECRQQSPAPREAAEISTGEGQSRKVSDLGKEQQNFWMNI